VSLPARGTVTIDPVPAPAPIATKNPRFTPSTTVDVIGEVGVSVRALENRPTGENWDSVLAVAICAL
jgi:hypothetical protein